jgi:hypothetical protein
MNTIYKNRIASPYTPVKKDVFDVSLTNHPARDVMEKSMGDYTLIASFTEDKETSLKLKHLPGVVAFICTIKNGDRILGIGRGHTVLGPQNRFVEKTVNMAFNYSIIDAVSKMTRTFNALRNDLLPIPQITATIGQEMITEKQKSYLTELISINVSDEEEKDKWGSQIDELTKEEASEAIQSFKK